MKNIIVVISMSLLSLFMVSCSEDDKGGSTDDQIQIYESGITFTAQGKLKLAFSHTFGGQALELAPKFYITQANDTIKVTQLSYYVSNVTLTSANGTKVNLGNYNLVGYLAGQPTTITLDNIPVGRYTSVSYIIGVDSLANSTGAHTGDLDPNNGGMYWTWSTGYVFIRLKGRFGSQNTAYSFDIGGDGNTMNVSHNLVSYNMGGAALTANVNVDLSKVFNSPNVYDLKTDAIDIHDSGVPSIPKLKTNISTAFSVTGIQ